MSPPVAARDTAQRRAVLEVLRAAPDHPTAAEIHGRVQAFLPGIGAATIYRTLHLLVESRAARELRLRDETVIRYDANMGRHDHVVCDGCGRVADVAAPVPATLTAVVATATGFDISGYDLRFHGHCPDCTSTRENPTRTQETH